MDFSLKAFTEQLRTQMANNHLFPYEDEEINKQKHKGRTEHIKQVAFLDNQPMYVTDNMIVFEIGNERAERLYPYYHILEDSPIIRKKGRADTYTKGSQDKVVDKGSRDYSIISFNCKTFSKEYQKNVRGMRKQVIDNATYFTGKGKQRVPHNEDSKSYRNIHYHYLENIALEINPILADMFGITYVGSKGTSLKDEYIAQEYGIISDYGEMLQIADILGM